MYTKKILILILMLAVLLSACSKSTANAETGDIAIEIASADEETTSSVQEAQENSAASETKPAADHPDGWSKETHGNDVDPNYAVVFPEDEVNQITITIEPEDWEAMQANLSDLLGDAGSGQGNREVPDQGNQPQPGENDQQSPPPRENDDRPRPGGENDGNSKPQQPPAEQGIREGNFTAENPMWVSATIEFEGLTWYNVGVRYKGNSSLNNGWSSGSLKLPFKLDFDEFEDEFPEIEDQRFYGFKQLSLANAFGDASFLRDAVTADILADAGLPAAETAFYEVILDYGEGPISLGLYTMIEVIDDTVVERYFGSDEGNIYEAEGPAASFAASTYDQIETSFQKKNNDDSDWSDIEALFDVLHSDLRTTDPSAWRAELESIFNVDSFLEWLAITAVIQHWDSYGTMSHNYYLYNDPATGQITWISWDHNETMMEGKRNRDTSLSKEEVNDNWPLIRFLLDDEEYSAQYLAYLAETIEEVFVADAMAEKYQAMADLIAPYAIADVGEAAFENAIQQLIQHAYQRTEAVQAYLASVSQ